MNRNTETMKHAFTHVDLALYLGVILFWGTSWIAIRAHLGVVAPEVSLVWRFLAATIIMFGWAAYRGERLHYPLKDHIWFFAVASMLFSFNFILQYYGGFYVKSGLMAVIFSISSIINIFLATLFLRQPVEWRVLLGGVLGFSGVCLMFWPEIMGETINKQVLTGLMFCLSGTFCFCLGNLVSSVIQRKQISLIAANSWGMAYGTVILFVICLIKREAFIIEPTVKYLGSLAWLATGASVGAFFCYLSLLRRIGSARAGYVTVLFPVVALAISTIFENYQWTFLAFLGASLALLGNLFVLKRKV